MSVSTFVLGGKRARYGAAAAATLALLVAIPGSAQAATAVALGTASSFAVLAGTGVTNTGPTTLNGDIGTFPTTTITGLGTITINGTNHAGDGVTQGAKSDLVTAYDSAAGQGPTLPIAAALDGLTLVPGVYNSASQILLNGGAVTLDAGGNAAAVWVFQAGSDLIVGNGSVVNLINGASSCNVFWQVGSSASLGTSAAFRGTIMALTSITLATAATVDGRVLARNGTVTLDTNTITSSPCVVGATVTPTPTPSPSQVTATPRGAVSTGDGSTSGISTGPLYAAATALALIGFGGAAVVATRRRRLGC
jgi:hypothetical protein